MVQYCASKSSKNANGLFRVYLDNVRRNKGPFTDAESFATSGEAFAAMEKMQILSVGATPRTSFLTLLQSYVRFPE
jgi:hypothetical protein